MVYSVQWDSSSMVTSSRRGYSVSRLRRELQRSLEPREIPLSESVSCKLYFNLLTLSVTVVCSVTMGCFGLVSLLNRMTTRGSPALMDLASPGVSNLHCLAVVIKTIFVSPVIRRVVFENNFRGFLFDVRNGLLR